MPITKLTPTAFEDNVKFRNIIINGDMSIAQRGTSATGIGNGDNGYHTVDRFKFSEAGSPTAEFTMSQDTDVPTGQGFAKSLKWNCTTADTSLGASDRLTFTQSFEGQNLQYLKKGTSSAESLTLSFWTKSTKTGTYICELRDLDNGRSISKSYTINSASTWEKKTITYSGDTTGTLDNDNAGSFNVTFWFGAGSNFSSGTLNTSWNTLTDADRAVGQVNLADSTDNEWYITGVQLEAGEVATPFEFLPYDVNLHRCHRYYEKIASGSGFVLANGAAYGGTGAYGVLNYKTKRAYPSLDQTSGTDYYAFYNNGTNDRFNSFTMANINETRARIVNADSIGVTSGHGGWYYLRLGSAYIAIDAEL